MQNIQHLIQLLQSLISPIVLISGVGLLLLSFTNRMGRVIDRSRFLVKELEQDGKDNFEIKKKQISVLYKRSRILQTSITAISITILLASLMILLLFLGYFTKINIEPFFLILFVIAIFCLIFSIIVFLLDVSLTLKALKFQIRNHLWNPNSDWINKRVFMNYKHLFGPVPSRRLGISLGVDLVPHKVCSLDCIYCEVGKTTNCTIERKEYVPINEVIN